MFVALFNVWRTDVQWQELSHNAQPHRQIFGVLRQEPLSMQFTNQRFWVGSCHLSFPNRLSVASGLAPECFISWFMPCVDNQSLRPCGYACWMCNLAPHAVITCELIHLRCCSIPNPPYASLGTGVPPELRHVVEHANIRVAKEHKLTLRVSSHLVWKPGSGSTGEFPKVHF